MICDDCEKEQRIAELESQLETTRQTIKDRVNFEDEQEKEIKKLKAERITNWCEIVNTLPISWTEREKEWMPLIERALKVQLATIKKQVVIMKETLKDAHGSSWCVIEALIDDELKEILKPEKVTSK